MTYRTHSTHRKPLRAPARRTRPILFALAVVGAALIGLAASPLDVLRIDPVAAVIGTDSAERTAEERDQTGAPEPTAIVIEAQPDAEAPRRRADLDPPIADPGQPSQSGQPGERDRRDRRDPPMLLGEADGVVPDGVTVSVFDDDVPAVANLDPDLLSALRQAATDAAGAGVPFSVNSGWRSPEYQEQLLQEAVVTYGSEEEAARWVATAETSAHVAGDAVDIGPADASAWLSAHGAAYGLCQIYENEPWHFELRPDAIEDGCPAMYADPTDDPRMR